MIYNIVLKYTASNSVDRYRYIDIDMHFLGDAVVKNLPTNAENTRDAGPIPGLGRSPGAGNGNPFLPEKFHGRGARRATVHGGHKELDMTEHTHTHTIDIDISYYFPL